ncbi:MAG: DUF4097 family beta strand repeat-containing protein [Planctomycetota bacterium]
MSGHRLCSLLMPVIAVLWVAACNTSIEVLPGDGAELPVPDGIDPSQPNTERSSLSVDFDGVETIRIELPTGRVTVSQSTGGGDASLKVTEIIVREGLPNDVLEGLLLGSGVHAERSFVDDSRLDIEATLAEGLADTDIVFDVRLVVPGGASIEVLLANGQVDVSELTGNVEILTHNGAVTVDHVSGNVVAETTNRSVEISDVTGNVQAETTDADITLRLEPGPKAVVSAKTGDGLIRLTIAQTTAATLDLDAGEEGTITANLSGFAVSSLETGAGFLRSVLNAGGGRIEATTAGGEIEFMGM